MRLVLLWLGLPSIAPPCALFRALIHLLLASGVILESHLFVGSLYARNCTVPRSLLLRRQASRLRKMEILHRAVLVCTGVLTVSFSLWFNLCRSVGQCCMCVLCQQFMIDAMCCVVGLRW